MPDAEELPPLEIAGREFARLQLAAVAGGAGLVVTYLLPWVEIVGPVFPEDADIGAEASPDAAEDIVEQGTVAASEIVVYPEVIAVLGLVTLVLSVVFWHRWVHFGVMFVGLVGTGIALFMREFLRTEESFLEVGDYIGPGSSFEPALGIWVTLVASVVLIGVGFAAFLNTFD